MHRPSCVTITGEPGVGKTRLDGRVPPLGGRPARNRLLAAGPLASLWGGHHLLGARRDDQGAGRDPRVGRARGCRCKAGSRRRRGGGRRDRAWTGSRQPSRRWSAPAAAPSPRPSGRNRSRPGGASSRASLHSDRSSLVFEDLHWADEALLAFVEHLVDWSTGVPLLVLCTARPELYERHPGWGGGKRNSNTVSLSPLAADDTARLLAALLHKAVLPAETQKRLLEQAGGNPLYAEEFVRMLTDQGVIDDGGRARRRRHPRARHRPGVDRRSARHTAAGTQGAASRRVSRGQGVLDRRRRSDGRSRRTRPCAPACTSSSRKELVRAARTSSVKDQAEYSFWHALVRDVAYSQIPRAERAQKHVAAAEWIERMAGERVDRPCGVAGVPLHQALDLTRAVGTTSRCRARARSRDAFSCLRAIGRCRSTSRRPTPTTDEPSSFRSRTSLNAGTS